MIITAYVKPVARENRVEWLDDDTVKIWVKAVAEKGKANEAVIKLLADELNVSKSEVELVRGATAKMKQFRIPD